MYRTTVLPTSAFVFFLVFSRLPASLTPLMNVWKWCSILVIFLVMEYLTLIASNVTKCKDIFFLPIITVFFCKFTQES